MTIGYKDICPSCNKDLTQTTNNITEEDILKPFQCPYCSATIAFKRHYSWFVLIVGVSWVIFTFAMYIVRMFFEHLVSLETALELFSTLSIVLLVYVLWSQHIKVIK